MANTNSAGQKGISGYTIKMIAVISMLIDHTAATILEGMLTAGDAAAFPLVSGHWELFYRIYMIMRGIGRFAFPIYCYLLVEGFYHTRSVPKYALRLFVFALISEVPFDLAIRHTLWDMKYNNVFFTLFLGLFVIALMRLVEERLKERFPAGVRWLLDALIVAAGAFVAEHILFTDYGAGGVLAIVILYLLYQRRLLGFALAVLELVLLSGDLELTALLMLFPMACYNGTRGRQMKYFFYAIYPVHLLILAGICWCLRLN